MHVPPTPISAALTKVRLVLEDTACTAQFAHGQELDIGIWGPALSSLCHMKIHEEFLSWQSICAETIIAAAELQLWAKSDSASELMCGRRSQEARSERNTLGLKQRANTHL